MLFYETLNEGKQTGTCCRTGADFNSDRVTDQKFYAYRSRNSNRLKYKTRACGDINERCVRWQEWLVRHSLALPEVCFGSHF